MTLVDRSKFKSTSFVKMQEEDEQVGKAIGKENHNGNRKQHKIKEGDNWYRLCPAHPDHEESSSIETKVVRFLPYEKQDRDDRGNVKTDKKGNPILVETVKPIFDARVHGGAPKDLVDEYEKMVKSIAEATYEKQADKDRYLAPLLGNKMKGGQHQGIAPRQSWLAYAFEAVKASTGITLGELGELEFGKAVRTGINRIGAQEQGATDVVATDACLTDVDNGRLLKVKYDKAAQVNDKYICSIDTEKTKVQIVGGGFGEMLKTYPLTDEQLTEFLALPPLINYREIFKRSDFELQKKGLELFEKKNNYGVYHSEEFQAIVEELEEYWPLDSQEGGDDNNVPDENNHQGDVYDLMDKNELVAQATQYGIKFMPGDGINDMREILREYEASLAATAPEDPEPEPEPELPAAITAPPVAATAAGLRTQVSGLRSRFGK